MAPHRIAALILASLAASAPARAAPDAPCRPTNTETVRITDILDGRTLRLGDGRILVLALLDGAGDADLGATEKAALASLKGAPARLGLAVKAADRYGRHHGFVETEQGESIQGRLIAKGLARARPATLGEAPTGCLKYLIEQENIARSAGRGHWKEGIENGPFAIKNAESRGQIVALRGHFALIEGTVRSVRKSGATTYLNFAKSYVQGFAAIIGRRHLKDVETEEFRLATLVGRKVRLRGWILMRQGPSKGSSKGPSTGPRMEISQRAQIEVLDRQPARADTEH